jgi:predicted HD phosphohydrolase
MSPSNTCVYNASVEYRQLIYDEHPSTPVGVLVQLMVSHAGWIDPNEDRGRVNAIQHASQAATRALRAGASDDEIVMALVHDAARPLSDVYHGEVVAEIMRDKLPDDLCEALRHHGDFQADLIHGSDTATRWQNESWYRAARRLASWDSQSFDPDYDAFPFSYFLPRLVAVMER